MGFGTLWLFFYAYNPSLYNSSKYRSPLEQIEKEFKIKADYGRYLIKLVEEEHAL